jgi:hypothetical protein
MNTRSSKEYRYIFTTTWKQASTSHLSSPLTDNARASSWLFLSYLFVFANFLFANSQNTQPHTQMYCSFVIFVNQQFPKLPASGTHCTSDDVRSFPLLSTDSARPSLTRVNQQKTPVVSKAYYLFPALWHWSLSDCNRHWPAGLLVTVWKNVNHQWRRSS